MKIKSPSRPPFLPALLALLLAGCATSPSPRLCVAASDPGWRDAAVRDALQSDFLVRFLPVRLAPYLDRPQIVTRLDRNQIKVDAFNRWGMSLDVLSAEILAGGVARALPTAYVDLSPSRTPPPPAYLVQTEIIRLDGPLAGPVELVAQWTLLRSGDSSAPVARRLVTHSAPAPGGTYPAYVEAVRQTLSALSADVAEAIRADRGNPSPAP